MSSFWGFGVFFFPDESQFAQMEKKKGIIVASALFFFVSLST